MPRKIVNRRSVVVRRRRGRKAVKKSSIPRGMNDAGQLARIKETISFTDLNPNVGYNFVFNLSQFQRASALAPNFKWYKATHVEWTIEPLYNTFQDGTTGAEVSVPYMFTTMNRTQDNSSLGFADMKAMGCKPQKLTGKKVIKYTPNWCSPGLNMILSNGLGTFRDVVSAGLKEQYGYLQSPNLNRGDEVPSVEQPITPYQAAPLAPGFAAGQILTNQVIYNGHNVWVDQAVSTGTLQPVARVSCTVHWHFKGPHCVYLADPAKTLEPAVSAL